MNRVLLRRIVAAVNLSDRSVPTLQRALQLAYLHGGELSVVHATNGRRASTEAETRRHGRVRVGSTATPGSDGGLGSVALGA